jgi:hypothetical protein
MGTWKHRGRPVVRGTLIGKWLKSLFQELLANHIDRSPTLLAIYSLCWLLPNSQNECICSFAMDGQCMVGVHADADVVMRLKSEWMYGGRYRLCTCHSWKNLTVHYVATCHRSTIPHWNSNSSKFCPTHQTVNISTHIFFNIEFGSIDLPNMYNMARPITHTYVFSLFWHIATVLTMFTYPNPQLLCIRSFEMDGQGCMVGIHADAGVVMRLKPERVYGGRYRLCTCCSWKKLTVHCVATWRRLTIPHWSSDSSKFHSTHQTVNISMHILNIEFHFIDLPNMYNLQRPITHMYVLRLYGHMVVLPTAWSHGHASSKMVTWSCWQHGVGASSKLCCGNNFCDNL